MLQTPIEKLQLSPRSYNCLKRAGINTVGDVVRMSEAELLRIRNFGQKPLEELRQRLDEHGFPSPREGGCWRAGIRGRPPG